MTNATITKMSDEEFDVLVEPFIERGEDQVAGDSRRVMSTILAVGKRWAVHPLARREEALPCRTLRAPPSPPQLGTEGAAGQALAPAQF